VPGELALDEPVAVLTEEAGEVDKVHGGRGQMSVGRAMTGVASMARYAIKGQLV